MWFGCRLPVVVVSQAYPGNDRHIPGNAKICPSFPPPQEALRKILINAAMRVTQLVLYYIDLQKIWGHGPSKRTFYKKRGEDNRVTRMMGCQGSGFIFRSVACMNYQ